MRENKVSTIWKSGGAVINGWLGIPSAVAAENMAQCGWDSLTVDLQHGLVDYQAAVGMMQAISTTGITPLARVPWNEPGIIMKLLDAGAFGIICPMINSRAEAEAFVGACRYAPVGYRSFGPVRAGWVHGGDYFKNANQTVLAIAMIETSKAMDNLEEITLYSFRPSPSRWSIRCIVILNTGRCMSSSTQTKFVLTSQIAVNSS